MPEKHTLCPECKTIYKVSVTQLTVAQGMVCCPRCDTTFNALLHLISTEQLPVQTEAEVQITEVDTHSIAKLRPLETTVLDIFDSKTENSNIDLRNYLNSVNQFNHDQVNNIPSMHLSTITRASDRNKGKGSTLHYISWGIINTSLILILAFQILWFNPSLLDRSPVLNMIFTQTCALLNCDTIDHRYSQMNIQQLKIVQVGETQTRFSGLLTNNYKKSLALPLIRVSLLAQDKVVYTETISADRYITDTLNGINRIPSERPYRFQFTLNIPHNSFDNHKIEIHHP